MKKNLYSFLLLLLSISVKAQVGQLDNTFTKSGFVKTSMGADYLPFNNVAVKAFPQTDGKILLVYESAGMTLIAKKNADGTPDVTYRNGGFSTPISVYGPHAVQQTDGKIVVAGYYKDYFFKKGSYQNILVARFNVDGTLDKTFGGDGQVRVASGIPSDVIVQPDGKILVLTYYLYGSYGEYVSYYLTRLTAEGVIDPNFNSIFEISGGASSIALQPDGKIMLGGSFLHRYNTDGSVDNSFGTNGAATAVDGVISLNILNSGKILTFDSDFSVTRYLSDGTVDNSFGVNGSQVNPVLYPNAKSMAVQGDGKILIAGITGYETTSSDFAVIRYTQDGFIDNSFSGDGIGVIDFGTSKDEANSVALLNDGRILAAGFASRGNTGYYDAAISRLDASGNPDNSFDGDSKLIDHIRRTNSGFNATAVQPDGKIVCAGYAWNGVNNDFMVVRYHSTGTPDNSFSGDSKLLTRFGVDASATGVAVQTDGKIIAVGAAGGDFAVVRYNTDGSPDNSFGNNGKVITDLWDNTEGALAVQIQSDGKILVSGKYAIVRYNSNGTLDNSFDGDGKVFTWGVNSSMAIQPDGKILVANSYLNVWRLNIDGSPDQSFGDGGIGRIYPPGADGEQEAKALAVLPDGRIIVGGTWFENTRTTDDPEFTYAVFTSDGQPDPILHPYYSSNLLGQGTELSSILVQDDGKIIMAGEKYIEGHRMFTILRLNSDFSLDNSFANNGVQYTSSVTTGDSKINALAVYGNRLYAAGYGQYPAYYGVLAAYKLPAAVPVSKLTGISTARPITTIKVSPNPAKNVLQFKVDNSIENEKATVQLIGINGKKWKETVVTANKNSVISLDISALSSGMYIINVVTRKKVFTAKFTKE